MVEIIPKIPQKISKKLTPLFYFALALLFFSFIGYLLLNSALKNTEEEIAFLEKEIAGKMTSEKIALEKEVLTSKSKIEKIFYLIERHPETSRAFEIVEGNSHPQVWFSDFNFNSRSRQLTLSGEVQNFEVLGQQIIIFNEEEKISKVIFSKVSITEEGRIAFDLLLSFAPNVFK